MYGAGDRRGEQDDWGRGMDYERTIEIDAPPRRVWGVMSDVERWPEWTRSVSKIVPLQPGPLDLGSRARVTQPRLGTLVWHVTALEPGRSFTWETRAPGTLMIGTHEVTPRGEGSTARLHVHSEGIAVSLLGWLMAPTGRRYVDMEAEGLKRRSERPS